MTVFSFHPDVEQLIVDNVRQTEMGARLILEPGLVHQLLGAIRDEIEKLAERGHAPIALCSPRTRLHVRRLVEQTFSMLTVVSYAEIAPDINVDSTGMVTLNNAN